MSMHTNTNHAPGSTDIDSKRRPAFLLGLVLALSVLFVALEYTSITTPTTLDSDFEDMVQDMDLQNMNYQRDMVPASAPAKSATTKIKPVEVKTTAASVEMTATNAEVITTDEMTPAASQQSTPALPQAQPQPNDDKPIHFRVVQQIPQFEGGMEAFTKWLTQNLCYPAEAQRGRIQGRVVVSFIINRDGTISSPKIEHSIHPLLDREALRVVRLMPRWTPGKENDKPCRTLFAIPIVFQL